MTRLMRVLGGLLLLLILATAAHGTALLSTGDFGGDCIVTKGPYVDLSGPAPVVKPPSYSISTGCLPAAR